MYHSTTTLTAKTRYVSTQTSKVSELFRYTNKPKHLKLSVHRSLPATYNKPGDGMASTIFVNAFLYNVLAVKRTDR